MQLLAEDLRATVFRLAGVPASKRTPLTVSGSRSTMLWLLGDSIGFTVAEFRATNRTRYVRACHSSEPSSLPQGAFGL
jgi:hypothetical protein